MAIDVKASGIAAYHHDRKDRTNRVVVVVNLTPGLSGHPSASFSGSMLKTARILATVIHTEFSARNRPAQILANTPRFNYHVGYEHELFTHLRPQPYTAFVGKVSPAPSGRGRNRCGLKERASWNFFSSHVIALMSATSVSQRSGTTQVKIHEPCISNDNGIFWNVHSSISVVSRSLVR